MEPLKQFVPNEGHWEDADVNGEVTHLGMSYTVPVSRKNVVMYVIYLHIYLA